LIAPEPSGLVLTLTAASVFAASAALTVLGSTGQGWILAQPLPVPPLQLPNRTVH
jgi:hypothetical protein